MINPSPEAGGAKRLEGVHRVGKQHAGARELGAEIVSQRVGKRGWQVEVRDGAAEELFPWSITGPITRDERSDVVVLADRPQSGGKPGPLVPREPLETLMTIEQRTVEIEDDRADAREH